VARLAVLAVALAVPGACRHSTAAASNTPVPSGAGGAEATSRPSARIPRDAARFAIDVVDDSTARFKPREAKWVRPGMLAYSVDPLQHDALIARLRVVSVWNETAVAVVTSQVSRVTTEHVVLMVPPTPSWWQSRRFWMGTLAGAVFGGAIGASVAH